MSTEIRTLPREVASLSINGRRIMVIAERAEDILDVADAIALYTSGVPVEAAYEPAPASRPATPAYEPLGGRPTAPQPEKRGPASYEHAPRCPVHQREMRPAKKGGWYCSSRVGEGYCTETAR